MSSCLSRQNSTDDEYRHTRQRSRRASKLFPFFFLCPFFPFLFVLFFLGVKCRGYPAHPVHEVWCGVILGMSTFVEERSAVRPVSRILTANPGLTPGVDKRVRAENVVIPEDDNKEKRDGGWYWVRSVSSEGSWCRLLGSCLQREEGGDGHVTRGSAWCRSLSSRYPACGARVPICTWRAIVGEVT